MRKSSTWSIAAASALALMLGVSTSMAYTNITVFGSDNDGDGGYTTSPPTATNQVWSIETNSVRDSFGAISNDTGQVIDSLLKEQLIDRSSGNAYSLEGVVTLTDGYGDDNNRIGMLLFNTNSTQTADGGGGLWLRLNTDGRNLAINEGINGDTLAETTASGIYANDGWIGTTITYLGEIRFVSDYIVVNFTFKDQNGVEDSIKANVLAADYTNGTYFGFATKWRQRGDDGSNRNVPPVFDYNSFSVESGTTNPPDTTPPSAPTNVMAAAEEFEVSLTWNAVTNDDVLFYNVYRSETSGSYSTNPVASVLGTNYLDTPLTNDITYYYVITAVDDSISLNESDDSLEVSATPILDLIAPSIPSNVVAEGFDRKIGLTWDAVGDADFDYYNIYRSVSGGATNLLATNVQDNVYVDQDLQNGITYTYTVTAVDDSFTVNESDPSDPASAVPVQTILPPPFTGWTQSTPTGDDDWGVTVSTVTYTNKDNGTINSSLLGEYVLNRSIGFSYTIEGTVRMVDGYADDNNRLGMYFFGDYPSISAADGGLAEDEVGALGLIFNTDDGSANSAPTGSNADDDLNIFVGVDNGALITTNRNEAFTPFAQDLFGTEVTFSTLIEFTASTNGTTNIVITASMEDSNGAVTQLDPLTVAATNYTGDYFGFVNRCRSRNYVEGVPGSYTGLSLPWVMEYLDFSITTNSTGYVSPIITSISVSGGDVTVSGISGASNAGAQYRLQSATGLVMPSWDPVATNSFDGSGNFSTTLPVSAGGEEFFRMEVGP